MQKKLLAVAVGAAIAAPMMAQADVSAYGIAQVEWANIKYDSGTYANFANNGTGNTNWSFGTAGTNVTGSGILSGHSRSQLVDNNQSRFGIKANEDLSGGMTGIAVVEFGVDLADGSAGGNTTTNSPIIARKMYVGLGQKNIGTLLLGRDATPYAYSGVALDPFVGTTLEARNNYGMSGNRDGWGVLNAHGSFVDGIFFNSASWAGVYANLYFGVNHTDAAYTCNAATNCTNVGQAGTRTAGDLSAVLGWKGNAGPVGLNFFLGYNKNGAVNETATVGSPSAAKFGAQVTFLKSQSVSLQYENTNRDSWSGGSADEAAYLFLGYKGDFGPVTAVAQLGSMKTGDTGGFYQYKGSYYAVGAIYNMSKTFRAFGGYRATKVDGDAAVGWTNPIRKDSVYTVGLRKDF